MQHNVLCNETHRNVGSNSGCSHKQALIMVALIALLACVRLDDAWSIVIKDYSTWQLNCIAICFCIRAAATYTLHQDGNSRQSLPKLYFLETQLQVRGAHAWMACLACRLIFRENTISFLLDKTALYFGSSCKRARVPDLMKAIPALTWGCASDGAPLR